jgi:hypothetical protein
MKGLFKVSVLALGLGLSFSQGASAAIASIAPTIENLGVIDEFGADFNHANKLKNATFSNEFDFKLSGNSDVSASITASFTAKANDYAKFDAKLYDKTTGDLIADLSPSYSSDYQSLSGGAFAAKLSANDTYEILVTGQTAANFSGDRYTGTLSVSPVPEAEEWAMMIVGVGLIGVVAGKKKEGGFKVSHG